MSLQGAVQRAPNDRELAASVIPLLSTVLAGFAVTVLAQLTAASSPPAGTPEKPGALATAVALGAAVPLLLGAALFAAWSVAYDWRRDTASNQSGDDALKRQRLEWERERIAYYTWSRRLILGGSALFDVGATILVGTYFAVWLAIVFALLSLGILLLFREPLKYM
jgi:hypothetical protein